MFADLHNHSQYSDGSLSVEDIVFYAKRAGLEAIAITDHDTLAGVEPAVRLGKEIGLLVIPGVEITAVDTSTRRPVHLLCYYPKRPQFLQEFLDATLQNRAAQKRAMIEKIQELYPVTTEHIERYSRHSKSIYESHIMQALADLGYTNVVIGPLMDELISKKGSCYVPSNYPDVAAVLDKIKEAGGIAVMAHPGQFDSLGLLKQLAREKRIHGAEYNHPRNTEADRSKIMRIANRYELILTGGTDFHGQYTKKPHPIGSFPSPPLCVGQLRALSDKMG